ncbi:MAG: MBL fold metallo-hydrolase [Spirochaetales bacterium]|nr:MBL fold metallo-hydrolase [Spirochaetales bacterium]
MKRKNTVLPIMFLLIMATVIPVFAQPSAEEIVADAESIDYSIAPEGFRVTIVGSGSPRLDLTRAGQSIYVEYKDTKILVDCGQWSTRNILQFGINIEKIENMFFTHQHADHNSDFWAFAIGAWGTPTGRQKLYMAGPSVQKLYDTTVNFFKEDLEYRTEIVGLHPEGLLSNVTLNDFTKDVETFQVDGVKVTAIPVPHTITTYAFKFEAGGHSVVISGDMKYIDTFAPFSKGADLLIMDGALTGAFSDLPPEAAASIKAGLSQSHIFNEDIARIVSDAQPSTTVITHILADTDYEGSKALYQKAGYAGKVVEAYDGIVFTLK